MEKSPNYTETAKMSDVALARNLIIEIAGHCWDGKADMLDRVYAACVRHGKRFTARRIRGFYHREAAHVKYHEMMDLAHVVELERAEQAEIESARKEHENWIQRISATSQSLIVSDEEFHGEAIAAFGRLAGEQAFPESGKTASKGNSLLSENGQTYQLDHAGIEA